MSRLGLLVLVVQLPILGLLVRGVVVKWAKPTMRRVIKVEDPMLRAERLAFIINLGTLASPPFGATIVRRDLERMAIEVFDYAAKWHGQGGT